MIIVTIGKIVMSLIMSCNDFKLIYFSTIFIIQYKYNTNVQLSLRVSVQ